MRYQVYMPLRNLQGSTLIDYIMGENPLERQYRVVYTGTVQVLDNNTPRNILDLLWGRHNYDEDGLTPRSMSIGDIIVMFGQAYYCEREGWSRMNILPPGVNVEW